jgi:probable HAF family extracellular repeat protein
LGINDNGVIAGYVQLSDGSTHAARWTSNNVFSDLGTLGGDVGQAEAVNKSGTIVGESEEASGRLSPFSWRSNTDMVGSGLGGFALGISDVGRVVGYKPLPNKTVAATGRNTTNILMLPLLPLGVNSYAVGVNTCGHIAGIADVPGGAFRAVRWTIAVCD